MCILSYLPPGVMPDEDGLWNGGINNPDGHGWAIVAGDKILVGKSLKLRTALDDFMKARKEHPDGPALFHSRWATHGKVTVANVHPFDVKGSATTVVAHNGILTKATPGDNDPRSDTRLFADDILLTQFVRLDRATAMKALEQWIGSGNKLVILTVNPRYQKNAYIVNQKAGHWDKITGIWHSNYDYLYTRGLYKTTYKSAWAANYYDWDNHVVGGKKKLSVVKGMPAGDVVDEVEELSSAALDDEVEVVCDWCGTGNVDMRGYCDWCYECQDCREHINDCQCWCGSDYYDNESPSPNITAQQRMEEEEAVHAAKVERALARFDARVAASAAAKETEARGATTTPWQGWRSPPMQEVNLPAVVTQLPSAPLFRY